MKIFVATHNAHKLKEISQILPAFEIVADDPEGVEETAPDFAGNALIKVRAIAPKHRGSWCMADDSGLEVAALGGAPGVRSARYAGEPTNTPANNALLLKNLDGVENRTANFTCAIALVDPEGREHVVEGKCFGAIARSPSGAEGFGYDPLFIPDGYGKSFAELSADEKNAISHRGRALEKVKGIVGKGGWLRLFRVVNLPTVPGDVFVGAALWPAFAGCSLSMRQTAATAAASVLLYMFGLADNDIVGAKTDKGRPLADGSISLAAARIARAICLFAALAVATLCDIPRFWWPVAFALALSIVAYNRTKWSPLMGACRALNVVCGVAGANAIFGMDAALLSWPVAATAGIWFLYIWAVTRYSKGEETDPVKKRRVGALVGGIVYLQLAALIALALFFPHTAALKPLLLAGAAMLVLLRLFKFLFPKVGAS